MHRSANDPASPPYDRSKAAGERVVLDLCARRLPGTVRGGSNWIDVRDVVKLAIAATERGRTGERYIAGGHWASLQELALMAEQAFGSPPPLLDAPMTVARLVAPVMSRWARVRHTEPAFTSFSPHAIGHYQKVSRAKAARVRLQRPAAAHDRRRRDRVVPNRRNACRARRRGRARKQALIERRAQPPLPGALVPCAESVGLVASGAFCGCAPLAA